MEPGTTRRALTLLVLAIGTVVLVLRARATWAYVADDAYISIQYASRLLHGDGLTWTSGAPRVEGYSNFLWVLGLAALGTTGMDLLDASRVLGIGCTWLLLVLVAWRAWGQPVVAAIGMAALLASGTVVTWSVGGLEAPMVALLVVASAHAAASSIDEEASGWWAGLLLAALTLARVDGFLFAPVVAGCVAIRSPKAGARILLLPVVALLAHTGFRWLYYGDVLPNIARIKVAASLARVEGGIKYIGIAAKHASPLVVTACVLGAWARGNRIAILLATGAGWAAYVAFVGGDVFPARRHTEVCVAVLAATLVEAMRNRRARWPIPLAVVAVGGFLWLQLRDSENTRADRRWTRQALALGTTLKRAFGQVDPLMAVRAAGALPYASGFRCIDMLGLNDREIAEQPPSVVDGEMLGHDHFDAAIVMGREPDLVVNGNGSRAQVGAMMEDLLAQPSFRDGYDLIPFRTRQDATAWVYVRRDSPRVGMTVDADRIAIPAWFFADVEHPVKVVKPAEPYVSIDQGGRVSLTLRLEPGRWHGVGAATGEVRVMIGGTEELVDVPSAANRTIDVVANEPATLRGVELFREP